MTFEYKERDPVNGQFLKGVKHDPNRRHATGLSNKVVIKQFQTMNDALDAGMNYTEAVLHYCFNPDTPEELRLKYFQLYEKISNNALSHQIMRQIEGEKETTQDEMLDRLSTFFSKVLSNKNDDKKTDEDDETEQEGE